MQQRRLGRTGIEVSEIGFGGWGIGGGWGARDDKTASEALHHAIELGVSFIDTAFMYGEGHSEHLIGQVLRNHPETVRVATKVPPVNRLFPAPPGTDIEDAYPKGHIRAHTERSLATLGLDSLDLQQLHVWSPDWLGRGHWQEEVDTLKAEGLVKAFGVSVNDHQPQSVLELVRSGTVDAIQTIYNVFDQGPEDELLPLCAQHGVGVLVRVALDEGGLTGTIKPETVFEPDDWRSRYFREDRPTQVHDRVSAIVADLGIEESQLAETALRYVLSSPEVSSVVVGMRNVRNVERNVLAGDGRGLPADQVQRLHQHRWTRNFYT